MYPGSFSVLSNGGASSISRRASSRTRYFSSDAIAVLRLSASPSLRPFSPPLRPSVPPPVLSARPPVRPSVRQHAPTLSNRVDLALLTLPRSQRRPVVE